MAAGDEQGSSVVVVFRADDRWQAEPLPGRLADDLDGLIRALRQQPAELATFGLVNVADEFFVAIRVQGPSVRLLLSDVTAAVAWDIAAQVLDALGVNTPEEDELDEVWPTGDLTMFGDLGLDEMELGVIVADLDAYADEMLAAIADRLGFLDVYERVVEPATR